MTQIEVEPSDPRLEPYRHMRTRNLTRFSQRFIAESRPLVERLLLSDYDVESVLIDREYASQAAAWIPDDVATLVLSREAIEELVGFHFHRGFMACGIRKPTVPWRSVVEASLSPSWTGMLAVGVQDPENLGVILRTCAALGVRDCFLGQNTADPLSRRVLRVSMGVALKLNLIEVREVDALLDALEHQHGVSVAASLQEPAIRLRDFEHSRPTLVLLGNEAFGLPQDLQARATHRIKIDMDLGVDSLNVSVAAGIILHYVTRLAFA